MSFVVADPGISKPGGGGGRILRSGVCFDTPSHKPYVFVVRVGNKIHIVNIVFWLKSKYFRVSPLRFTKTNTKNFKPGCACPTRGSWIRLCSEVSHVIDYHTFSVCSLTLQISFCPLSLKSLMPGTDIVLAIFFPDNHYIPMLFTLSGIQ